MTDRYNSLIVALEKDIQDDDAEYIINAIRTIKGVKDVTGNIVDADTFTAVSRIYWDMRKKLMEDLDTMKDYV